MKEEKGAEATVKITKDKVIKKRKEKEYRHPNIDKRLRKDRTEEESRRMAQANKYGVKTPKILNTDNFSLEMDNIRGHKLRNCIKEKIGTLENLGSQIAILHNQDIIHGDLTTSNILIQEDTNNPYIIDFGLSEHSQRIEDKAVDLHLLKQVLETSHPEVFEQAWSNFIEGYRDKQNSSEEVLNQLEEVEKRGRYK